MDLKQNFGSIEQKKGRNSIGLALNPSQQTSDQYFCSRCEQTIHSDEKDQHEDWHFAKDLQAQDDAIASERPAQAAPQPQRLDLKQAGDSKSDQPPDYPPPSYPPPRNVAGGVMAIRRHTNQVIEAAKVRARDEVHFAFTLT
jgi:hypothetical protein